MPDRGHFTSSRRLFPMGRGGHGVLGFAWL